MRNQIYRAILPPAKTTIAEMKIATLRAPQQPRRRAEHEAARQEWRRLSDEPLPDRMEEWPKYFVAALLSADTLQRGITSGIFAPWRSDNQGRLWIRLTETFYKRLALTS